LAAAPLEPAEFARLMAPFAPFESYPHLVVAVSGGADSMALALLADGWARDRDGKITALTVDHRLRPDSAAEAARVATWLGRRGIAHATLVRDGPAPRGDVQAAAREARYGLLEAWCAAHGVLHLLTGHQREDQAETVLLRLARGSGLDGLAGMAALTEHAQCRVLRPLLGQRRTRLADTLVALGQAWIDDPSNRNPTFARARLRRAEAFLAEEGLGAERLAATASRLGRARAAIEPVVAALLARAVWFHPAGFAWLAPAELGVAPDEIGLRALATLLASVAGASYPPRLASIERLYREIDRETMPGRTLGGCRILPRRGRLLVCREPEAVEPPLPAPPGATTLWDHRFELRLPASAPAGLTLGALGDDAPDGAASRLAATLPAAARATLPALRDEEGLVAVPHLDHFRGGAPPVRFRLFFRPRRSLTQSGFTVV